MTPKLADALQAVFCTLEKFRTTRLEHQRLFEAQQVILEFVKEHTPVETQEDGKNNSETP